LCFRIAAVPFHFYAPDVFRGTTPANAALLSFVPKVVGFVALLRLLPLTGAGESLASWLPNSSAKLLLAVLAVATMFVGNLMALRQKHLYRLMAYSSIAHAGYMLAGLAVGDGGPIAGTEAVLFYLAIYGLMTIGVFALFSAVSRADRPLEFEDDLRGLNRDHPAVALMLAVCLFSLTGLPPTAGFLGKLNIFLAAWSEGSPVGRNLAATCANCHGTNGVSAGEVVSLAGKPKDEIARKMQDFKTGKAPGTIMPQLAKGYTDEQIDLVAGWFAAQQAK
jgi:NADH-quinone oxidoreductase subunit N